MGPRLIGLALLALLVAGCGGDRVPASESLEAQLKDANTRANDGTSVNREHSLRSLDERGPRA